MHALRLALLIGLALPLAGAGDPGIAFRVDRERFELQVVDLRDGEEGPRLKVALGSPGRPTPRGSYPLDRVILNPAWSPGPTARAAGARALPASEQTPMGVAKIPFGASRVYAIHGGGLPVLVGKPISGGCIRARDEDLLTLVAWLDDRGALRAETPAANGERHRRFRRPARLRTD